MKVKVLLVSLVFGSFGFAASFGMPDMGGMRVVNSNDPVNPTDLATKRYVDNKNNDFATQEYVDAKVAAAGGGGGMPALGSDMLNTYFAQKGLFTPHANNCDGTEAFVAIGDGSVGYCIEKNERSEKHWEDAKQACASLGKRLPEIFEWKFACQNASSLGLSNMTNNWEWSSNFALPKTNGSYTGSGAQLAGNGNCARTNWYWVGNNIGYEYSYSFRCVR
jgi:hypothetical protein